MLKEDQPTAESCPPSTAVTSPLPFPPCRTGGLNDTVFDLDHDPERAAREGLQPNGYSFEGTDAGAVDYAMNRALDHWYDDRQSWNALARTVMEQDWSWNRPALDYLELYYGARK